MKNWELVVYFLISIQEDLKFRKFSRRVRASRIVRVGAIAVPLGRRTQHHRTFRPGISILRKRRTEPFPRAFSSPLSTSSRFYSGRTKGRRNDNFITALLSRSHSRHGGDDVANCYWSHAPEGDFGKAVSC